MTSLPMFIDNTSIRSRRASEVFSVYRQDLPTNPAFAVHLRSVTTLGIIAVVSFDGRAVSD